MRAYLAALVLALVPGPALCSNWKFVGSGLDKTIVYVDLETISHTGQGVYVWAKFDFRYVQKTQERDSLNRMWIDCNSRNTALLSFIGHKPDGSVVQSWTLPQGQTATLEPIGPDTLADFIAKEVCR